MSQNDSGRKPAGDAPDYEGIIRLRGQIVSGSHARIKLPADRLTVPVPVAVRSYARAPSEPGEVDTRPPALQLLSAHGETRNLHVEAQNPRVTQPPADAAAAAPAAHHPEPLGAGAPGINPILLEKSDQLVRAEFQLHRLRLERDLKEELDQERASKQVPKEAVNELDLSNILAQAYSRVQATATTTPFSADGGLTANDEAATSDSFDTNTFYSSNYETPESNLTSRVHRATDEPSLIPRPQQVTDQGNLAAAHAATYAATYAATHERREQPAASSSSYPSYPAPALPVGGVTASGLPREQQQQQQQVPGLFLHATPANPQPVAHGPPTVSRTEPSPVVQRELQVPETSAPRLDLNQPAQPRPPVIRNHELVPIAPQPERISPLAVVTAQDPVFGSAPAAAAVPAQVAALANYTPVAVASDSSSSHGARNRRGGNKKRKSDRQAPYPPYSPGVKLESRSPSPLTAPAYIRPNKRPRQSQTGRSGGQARPAPPTGNDGLGQVIERRTRELEREQAVERRQRGRQRPAQEQAVERGRRRDREQRADEDLLDAYETYDDVDTYKDKVKKRIAELTEASISTRAEIVQLRREREALEQRLANRREQAEPAAASASRQSLAPPPRQSVAPPPRSGEAQVVYHPSASRQSVAPPPRAREPEVVYYPSASQQSVAPLPRSGGPEVVYHVSTPRQSVAPLPRAREPEVVYVPSASRQSVAPLPRAREAEVVYHPPASRQSVAASLPRAREPEVVYHPSASRQSVAPLPRSGGPEVVYHASTPRQSVAPLPRAREPEVVYRHLPPQPLPDRLPASGPYGDGVVYASWPLPGDPPDTVYVSQPQHAYGQGDGQYQPQQRGYVEFVRPPERRMVDERPVEYVSRAASPQGFQPFSQPRYSSGPQPYFRMYSARPEAGGREPRGPTRGSGQIAFIERPRGAAPDVVYYDDDVYE